LKEKIEIKYIIITNGCLRGYLGKWEIKDEKLFLKTLQAQADIQDLHQFPKEIERVENYLHNN